MLVLTLIAGASSTRGVILMGTDDPTANTTEPDGALAGSGWQFEATFGPFLATAIGPHHFVTVQHIGQASNVFEYQGSVYTITQSYDDTESDLRIYEVAEEVPTYAPLYVSTDEAGRSLVVIGRGTQRGDPIYVGGFLRGWQWGATDEVQRWGENVVASISGNMLYATFDQAGGPNEADLSSGDSGGAMFIQHDSVWRLAGINYGVDGPFAEVSNGPAVYAALFDARGFYGPANQLYSGEAALPSGFYSIRISDRLAWIYSIVFPGQPVPQPDPSPSPTPSPTPNPSPTPPLTNDSSSVTMLSPVPETAFDNSSVTFTWSGNGKCTLSIGTSPGTANIFSSGKLAGHSVTVANLPTDGSEVYVRLRSLGKKGKTSHYSDYSYTAATLGDESEPTPSPTPNKHHKHGV